MTSIQPAGKNQVRRIDASQHGPAPTAPPPESLVQILWRRRWTVLLMCVLAMGSGLVYLWKTPYLYRAQARVYVQERQADLIGNGTGAVGGTSTPTESYLFLQCELIKSDAVLKYMEPPVLVNPDGKTHTTILPNVAKGGLTVEFTTRDGIIFISDDSSRADESASVVNAVVSAYVKYQEYISQSTLTDLLKKIDEQEKNLESDLQKAEKERQDFVKLKGMDIVDLQNSPAMQEFQVWSQRVSTAHIKQDEAQQELAAAIKVQDKPGELSSLMQIQRSEGMTVPVDTVADELNANLDLAQNKLQQMKAGGVGPKSPAMLSIVSQISDLKTQIAQHDQDEASNYIDFLRHQNEYADDNYRSVKAQCDIAEANAVKLNADAAHYATLVANEGSINKLKDILGDRARAVGATVGNDPIKVEVLEYASAPNSPSSPQPAKTLPAALVAGLILGVGCALVQNWIDQRIVSSDEIRLRLSIPLLALCRGWEDGAALLTPH
jgi:succinoglycan biosynthesis transport protein ExoP